jgi:hypothetical protein
MSPAVERQRGFCFLFTKQIFDPAQRHLTNQGVGGGDYGHFKPEAAISCFSGLDAMPGGFDGRNFPTPKAGMLVFVNHKGKPDAESG